MSITCVPGKLVKSFIKFRIVMPKNVWLQTNLDGFLKGNSCLTKRLGFHNCINKHVDRAEPKAFSKVPHQRVLNKLGS